MSVRARSARDGEPPRLTRSANSFRNASATSPSRSRLTRIFIALPLLALVIMNFSGIYTACQVDKLNMRDIIIANKNAEGKMETRVCPVCGFGKPASLFRPVDDMCLQCKYPSLGEKRRKLKAELRQHIYILVDPRDSRIYYVGCTHHPKSRLATHMADTRRKKPTNKAKCDWLTGVVDSGATPLLVVIETVSPDRAQEREVYWISTLADLGAPLLNHRHLLD